MKKNIAIPIMSKDMNKKLTEKEAEFKKLNENEKCYSETLNRIIDNKVVGLTVCIIL